jgi:diacylglycerol kinase (ATP)
VGWGGGYEGESLSKILTKVEASSAQLFDRWWVNFLHHDSAIDDRSLMMNNYFSVGVDASVALQFHRERERNPKKFQSRTGNKTWYGWFGFKETIAASTPLNRLVEVQCTCFFWWRVRALR